jgi:hypothetical protein
VLAVDANKLTMICDYLCKLVQQRETVSLEILSDYISEIQKLIGEEKKTKEFSYYELVDRCRRYQESTMKESERFSYMVGAILGTAELYDRYCEELDSRKFETRQLSPTSRQYMVLSMISEQPGISRKELLNRMPDKRSDTALSHITSTLQKRNYITFCKVGQEKEFYATERGDNYVVLVKAQQQKSVADEMALTDELLVFWNNIPENSMSDFDRNAGHNSWNDRNIREYSVESSNEMVRDYDFGLIEQYIAQ